MGCCPCCRWVASQCNQCWSSPHSCCQRHTSMSCKCSWWVAANSRASTAPMPGCNYVRPMGGFPVEFQLTHVSGSRCIEKLLECAFMSDDWKACKACCTKVMHTMYALCTKQQALLPCCGCRSTHMSGAASCSALCQSSPMHSSAQIYATWGLRPTQNTWQS